MQHFECSKVFAYGKLCQFYDRERSGVWENDRMTSTVGRGPRAGDSRIVPHAVVKELYRKMIAVFFIEERLKILNKQGKISFLASTRGHEKAQIGTAMMISRSIGAKKK